MKVIVDVEVSVAIEVPDSVVDDIVNGEGAGYGLHTREAILDHLAFNCVVNGVESGSRLDGFSYPNESDQAQMKMDPHSFEVQYYFEIQETT